MIRFDSVTKTYRSGSRPALDGVSLEIGSGEFVFLVGASGSGKSSLLRLILREDRPTTGEIHVLGQRLTTISSRKVPYFRRTLGVVFQDFRLLPNKTVYANVAFTLQVIGKSRGFIQEAVPDVLRMVGLEDKARSLPTELSGGEQQRVAIARAVVNKPAVLLADEPTGNLDPTTSEGIMQVLATINASGTTVVMATHDVTIVDKMQRRVVELIDGRIVRDELEATYVTSAVPVQGARSRPSARPMTGSGGSPVLADPVPADPVPADPVLTEPPPTANPGTWQQQPAEPRRVTAEVVPAAAPADPDRPQAWLSRWLLTDDEPQAAESDPAAGDQVPAWSLTGGSPESRSGSSAGTATDLRPSAPRQRPPGASASAPASPPASAPASPSAAPAAPGGDRPPLGADLGADLSADLDLGLSPDADARLRSNAKHRVPLPQHLDFLAGLGLRDEAQPEEPGTVGPSS